MKEFVRIYESLHKQCSYHCRHLGHLKGLIENDDWIRVVNGSTIGRVLFLGNSEIINSLILFNTRMFDKETDTITIHKLAKNLPSNDDIEVHHRARMKKIKIDYDLGPYYSAREKFCEISRALKKDRTKEALRALRNHTLAHNLEPEIEPTRATLNDLVKLTGDVNELVGLAGFISISTRSVYPDFVAKAESETRVFYSVLPALASLENSSAK